MSRLSSLPELEHAFATTLRDATPATRLELERLARYRAPPPSIEYPTGRLAAVLVLLHLNPKGELSVTLTTRSKQLRSHPGETALPGGRWEQGDGEGGEWTALREAHEEIGLPLPPRPDQAPSAAEAAAGSTAAPVLYLTTLPAYSSRTLLVVLPVVYLLLQPAALASTACLPSFLRPNPGEVDAIFHLPLRAFLLLPSRHDDDDNDNGTESQTLLHTHTDYTWLLSRPYRLHAFSSPATAAPAHSAVTGLTADIVLDTALLAHYGTFAAADLPPDAVGFERRAQGQMEWSEIVVEALKARENGKNHETGLGAQLDLDGSQNAAVDQRTSAV